MLSPRTEALAFRIWAYATPKGWDVTIPEIAEALDTDWRRVQQALRLKGWLSRVRRSADDREYYAEYGAGRMYAATMRAMEWSAIKDMVDVSGLGIDSDT